MLCIDNDVILWLLNATDDLLIQSILIVLFVSEYKGGYTGLMQNYANVKYVGTQNPTENYFNSKYYNSLIIMRYDR